MRLHSMTLSAFGPYPGRSRIDFDRLAAGGLFLLHGPTGAGKTAVLDAVCYALYGEVPGTRQRGQLRSDHADPGTPTEVLLHLTVGGRRLEITRRPEQPRPKRRGTGITWEKPVTLLREYQPDGTGWRALSRSHQEIGEEIRQILGMSREQFCQVVLLPQGDFARFLRSDAAERAELLGRLFDTGRFEAVERWLADARRTAEARVRDRDAALLALGHRIQQAAGAGHDEPPPDLAAGDAGLAEHLLRWAAVARCTARERHDIALLARDAARHARQAASGRWEDAAGLAARQQRHALARRRAAELDARRPEFEDLTQRLARADAAARVAPALEALHRADTERERRAARRRTAAAPLPADLAGAGADLLVRREREARQALGGLDAARRAERRAAEIAVELAGLERESAADEDHERETARWLRSWEATRAAGAGRVEAARDAATEAERLAGRLAALRRRAEAARLRDELAERRRRVAQRLAGLRENAARAREEWLDRKEARLRGLAADLAAGLADGVPCPVCGSPEHPEPARPGARHVDRAAEDAALAAYQGAESERARAESEWEGVGERLAAAGREAGDGEAGRLAAEITALAEAEAAARRTAADTGPAAEALRAAEDEHARRLEAQRETQKRQAARASHQDALAAERAALAAVPGWAGAGRAVDDREHGAVRVAEQAARLERTARLLAEAAEAARAVAEAEHRYAEAEREAERAARAGGFASTAEAAGAALPEAERTVLRERSERYAVQRAAVAAELDTPELRQAAALPPAGPEARRAALDRAEARLREASTAEADAGRRRAELDQLSRQAARLARESAPLRTEHARLRALASLTAGTAADNELRMRLESYVLAGRLEQVAAEASARLRRMSSGRYTLTHTDARGPGRARSGLGLRVLDAWTGTERDTGTLSGGEGFFVSLALALGLADVVTGEAGGVRLDTLFIDEGFGSLDEQTLDEVLDVLDALRERDRVVGIVSHVADLRQRIPAQLEIVKGRAGSTVRHRAGTPAPEAGAPGAG